MRKLIRVLGIVIAALVVVLVGAFAYVQLTWQRDYSDTPLPAIAASADPAVIARGEYLANAVAHCSACHLLANQPKGSTIDWTVPLVGGHVWDVPLFGTFVAANITPDEITGIGRVSDGQIARAIRYGVD